MQTLKSWLLAAVMAVVLAACSGSNDNSIAAPGSGGSGGGGGSGGSGGSGGGGANASAISVSSSSATIPQDGSADATITAYVRDANNALLPGVTVTFTATSGGISGSPAVTDPAGVATAHLITAGDSSLRTITVSAAAGSLQGVVTVQVVASSQSTTVQMGNGTGTGFQPGVIGISNTSLSAGGSTSVSVSLVQSGGTLYTGSAAVSFNSPCIAAGTAQVRVNGAPVSSVTTTTGIATATYVAQGCSGTDAVTATASISQQSLSANGTVTVAAATVGSIEFVSATPTNIALQGTGDVSRPESSTVVFRVKDASNGAVQGASVSFALNTAVGGIALTSTSAVSDNQGLVQTVVNAGTVATSVKVTATVTSAPQQISTQSSQLTVTTGIPTDASFSLSVECFNIEGWQYDGVIAPVTARLGDRFQNPVPDGTAVTFTAEGGNIQSQCTTTTTATEGGVCTVNFRSSNPRPADGRVTLLAKAIGEESFVDANGNGSFDNGESFTDIPEPFRDDNENGVYDVGEDFFDFNNNQTRDPPDGIFNGVLCKDTTGRCGGPATRSIGIGEQNVVILSGSDAVITDGAGAPMPASIAMSVSSATTITFWVRDLHNNVLPGGTTVALTSAGSGGVTVTAPTSFPVPCSAIPAGSKFGGITLFSFGLTSGTSTGTSVISLTITTPKKTVTIAQISVVVS